MKPQKRKGLSDIVYINDATYFDYLERMKKIALAMFEWVNLPNSMDARYLEMSLFYRGKGALLNTEEYGFINTKCATSGGLNIYDLPVQLQCYSHDFTTYRKVYNGLRNDNQDDEAQYEEAVLVKNNPECTPTADTIELFALRLYEAQRTIDVNLKAQRTPVLVLSDEKQRLTMRNMYLQFDGNTPVIFGDKNQLSSDSIKALKTDAPYIIDKVEEYKKSIWNEFLTFMGINNIGIEKKERLVAEEGNENNELINFNLQSLLAPRKQACKEFNERFGQDIDVKLRSDLHNVIKQQESIIKDFTPEQEDVKTEKRKGLNNGKLHY